MGLTITKGLVEALGGSIGVDSVDGDGADFWFEIQLERSLGETLAEPEAILPDLPRAGVKQYVLVVEDNVVNQMILGRMLERQGHKVSVADNGVEALKFLEAEEAQELNMVLMDIRMPEMDGPETTRRIRELDSSFSKLPIVACTADVLGDKNGHFWNETFDAVLTKPIDPHKLFEILEVFGAEQPSQKTES